MIRITDFETDYLTYEIKKKRVVNPKWFRCPVVDSPEMQAVLCADMNTKVYGLAMLGLWEQLQRWCMRHIKRNGEFRMKSGVPMNLHQIAFAIGIQGEEEFLGKSIEVLMGVGWLSSIEGTTSVLPSVQVGVPSSPPTPKSLPEPEDGKHSSSQRYPHQRTVKELVRIMSKNPECPLATENPRSVETALCDAAVEGRDVETIVEGMSIYYSLEIGKDKYRTRAEKFIRNRKEDENWDSWFTDLEAKGFCAKKIKEVNDAEGGSRQEYLGLLTKYNHATPSEIMHMHKGWLCKRENAGHEI